METTTFRDPKVRQEMAKFVYVKLYLDKPAPEGPANLKIENDQFKSNDRPLYVLLDSAGTEISRLNFAEFDAGKFVAFLEKATKTLPARTGSANGGGGKETAKDDKESSKQEAASEEKTLPNYDEGLASAKKGGKPLFLEFTGYT